MDTVQKKDIYDEALYRGDTFNKSELVVRRIDKYILFWSALMLVVAVIAAAGYQDHVSSHADAITIMCLFFWAVRFFEIKTKKISERWFN